MSLLAPARKLAARVRGAYDRVGDALLLRAVRVAERAFQPRPGIKQLRLDPGEARRRFVLPLADPPVRMEGSRPALLLIHGITDRVFGFAFMAVPNISASTTGSATL